MAFILRLQKIIFPHFNAIEDKNKTFVALESVDAFHEVFHEEHLLGLV
ncbi:MAG: hypothetical protein IKG62_02135 [Lachnospiraceae bacterium]|nr:hypothetical protein [Lachnospiraceae bacterium]